MYQQKNSVSSEASLGQVGPLDSVYRSNSVKRAVRVFFGSLERQPAAVFSFFQATRFGVALAGVVPAPISYVSSLTSIEKE